MFGQLCVASITPFKMDGKVDGEYFKAFLPILEENHVDSIVVFGTNGEGPSLEVNEIIRSLDVIQENQGSMKVIVGVLKTNIKETQKILNFAEEIGASGALIAPPFYFKNLESEGLYQYFNLVIKNCDLPILLYNVPKYTQVSIDINLVNKLKDFSQIVGVKDSSGDINQTKKFIHNFPELMVYCGSDSLINETLQAGCHGVVTALGNPFPQMINKIIQSLKENNYEKASREQKKVNEIRTIVKSFPQISGIKWCIHHYLGLPITYVKPPLFNLTENQQDDMFKLLDGLVSKKIKEYG
ncbi:MAG: dihydrodipicolinate synthase family protein [Candidatus Hodarchaeales archaeon]|jgi:4-hydroxy-tetrahydrodipicolinate synthase